MTEDQPKGLVGSLLPRTLAGLATWFLIFASGMAVSGVALFAYYQYRVSALQQELLDFNERFEKEFQKRTKEFNELVKESKADIEEAAGGVGSKTNELTALVEKVAPSIARIEGLDVFGKPAIGSGFIVTSNANESWILTNLATVAGATAGGTPVGVRIGTSDRQATVYSWDDGRDLALIILRVGNLPSLEWAEGDPVIGIRVWAVGAAPGRLGAAAAEGVLIDVSKEGLLTDGDVPAHISGGPLLTKEGKVLGVLSLSYAPPGYPPSNGWAVPIRLTCQQVLRCP